MDDKTNKGRCEPAFWIPLLNRKDYAFPTV